MNNYQSIAQIKNDPVRRIPTGIDELDWLYGLSKAPGFKSAWGIPVGKLSLWAGAAGVGKSRAAIELAKSIVRQGYKVLYFQLEADLSAFSNSVKKGDISNPKNFLVSNVKSLSEMLTIIQTTKPNVVFIDSINMVNEFGSGTSRNIKSIIEGHNRQRGFRDICNELRIHTIFLGQLNKNGDTKGSSSLPHLVDIVFQIEPLGIDGYFVIRVGSKHRYGRTGEDFVTYWEHIEEGVRCDSQHRLEDHLWCETHGVPFKPMLGLVNPSIPSVESINIYFIVDYKTAKFTENQDALLPLYNVQLNSYALIGKQCGFSPICGLGLVYYEPQTNVSIENIDSALLEDGFSMPFEAHLLRLELDAEGVVLPLLKRVRELGELEAAPTGRVGCEDCRKLADLVGLL